ncbi:hypothetical protein LUW74_17500 [Actinomadura madurae]|uniref:hypothetical protein n=1 Tax=Actinomadura madurae TaxID=1993 RepID=UPI002026247F|nr:hypothetical protein [Actinomadura madurae]URN04935.1 hypothetical protein LUW74_17500 [Actinomadura madurae]
MNRSDSSTTRVDSALLGSHADDSLVCAPVSLPASGIATARMTIQTASTTHLPRRPQGREENLFAPVIKNPQDQSRPQFPPYVAAARG